jgi:RNA polymerase sigma-70 factor (ECF subfamily)
MDGTDILTVLKAQTGDRTAMVALLREMQAPLLRYVSRLTARPDLAADIVQETLLQIYRKLGSLTEAQLFRAWCYRIASREASRRLRREQPHIHEGLEEAEQAALASDEISPLDATALAQLPKLLDGVSPASRAVLVLHFLEDMKLREVTEVLGVSLGTVKSRLAYGLRTLRERVAQTEIKSEERP